MIRPARASWLFCLIACLGAGIPGIRAALASNPDTCVKDGGTADCAGAVAGPYSYTYGSQFSGGPFASESAAVGAFQAQVHQAVNACTDNVRNPAWQPLPPDNGNFSATIAQGQDYWTVWWYVRVENQQQKQYLTDSVTYSPTSNPACGSSTAPSVGLLRTRTVDCPTGYYGNAYSTPLYAWCFRYPLTNTTYDTPKSLGPCKDCGLMVGHPINVATGNKYLEETDYRGSGPYPLEYTRRYNSQAFPVSGPGAGPAWYVAVPSWRTTYERGITYAGNPAFPDAYAFRHDGRVLRFRIVGGVPTPDADVNERLSMQVDGSGSPVSWTLTTESDETETYDSTGRLTEIKNRAGIKHTLAYDLQGRVQSVTHSFGQQLQFAYDYVNRVQTVTLPDGSTVTYTYGSYNNLTSVTYPNLTVRSYQYTDPNTSRGLSAIIDENSSQYATYAYGGGSARASSSQLAGGADHYTFSYSDGSTVVTDAFSASRTYTHSAFLHTPRGGSISAVCPACGNVLKSKTWDGNGNPASRTDFDNNQVFYAYDLTRNLETSRTEAYGTPHARTITTTWNPSYRLPALITEADRTTGFTYDPSGNLLTKTITESATGAMRVWTYTYNSYGRMLTADGPRTDVVDKTTYAYYTCTTGSQCGQLHTVTDAVGHVTTYSTYNAHGQPLTITDPNSVVTTLTYDLRQRLTSRQVGTETTSFSYWPTGLLKQVTLPDSSFLLYTYDGAHRLTQINDELGNKIVYTLDAMGNRTAENSYDSTSFLHRTHSRVINALNELYQDVNAAGTAAVTTTFGYDNNGNQTSIAAPLARNTANGYDELNRLKQITDPASGLTDFAYDAEDNLTSVIDPRNLTTSYTYTGFGDLKTQASPDTGTTTHTYDSGGNLSTSTDARGAISTYAYDVLNRVTSVAYKIGSTTDQTIAFTYDAGTNGIGHLTGASDANHSLSWTYDGLGRVTGKGQVVGTVTRSVGYGYTNGNLTSLVTPSGQTIVYGYNSNHQVTSIAVNGTTLLNGVTYEPFGGANKWTWGNGTVTTRTYDTDQKITQISSQGLRTNTYDNAFRITKITDTTAGASTYTYGYDLLDRVTSGVGGANQTFTYDANGNRLTVGGGSSSTYTVSPSSNRVTAISGSQSKSYTYDAAGHPLTYSPISLTYNDRGRLKSVQTTSNTETIVYNALGQMVKVSGGAPGTVLYVYDEAGHIIGEYSSTGALVQETVWLGDIPVATLRPGSPVVIYYVHTDHLNTPHLVTDSTSLNKQRWRWFPPAFGDSAPNTNPANAGVFTYDLRFPGQIYDSQAGLNQNYFRDYDPQVGRYVESDPIGLGGGINTYSYAGSNPLSFIDPNGTQAQVIAPVVVIGGVIVIGCYATGACQQAANAVQQAADEVGNAATAVASAIADLCKRNDDDPCDKKLDRSLLKQAKILGQEHAVKADALGTNKSLSQFDLCGCKDGRVVVKAHGCAGPIVAETGYRWK